MNPNENAPNFSDETQNWVQSRTVKAAITAAVPTVAKLFGLDIDTIAPYLGDVVTLIGSGLAIVFRIGATKIIR